VAIQPISWSPTGAVRIIDQRALPETEITRDLETADAVADAIRTLQVRGAPLIGIAAAMGLVAATRDQQQLPRADFLSRVKQLATLLGNARPTAVNLRWSLDRMLRVAESTPGVSATVWERLRAESNAIWDEDREMCRRIGECGLTVLKDGANVLTHCNTGALATGGIGTALAPIYLAHEQGRRVHVYVDETRPLLQGSRLTAWELMRAGVPCTLITDGMAAPLMQQKKVAVVLVGADRICANGDFANKIGTYGLAVLAQHHGVPFYCAAPWSTVDVTLASGDLTPIEQRASAEVTVVAGRPIAPNGMTALNPAFDVTPARYVTAFITERGLVHPPFSA
jgi:methylthioribose-1-phosphate isomerase